MSDDARDLDADRRLIVETIRAAGDCALSYYGKPLKAWDKAPGHPVTEADLAVDALIRDRLCAARPDYGWLSEESADDPARLDRARVWIVDPIDGTRAFMRNQPEFSISVALVEHGRPLLGAISQPVAGRLYLAVQGTGATLNDRRLRIAPRTSLGDSRMLADETFFRSARHWPTPWPDMRYRRLPSIALRLAMVGGGEADATVFVRPKSDWDVAAGDLVVTEAGGRCCDETGAPPVYNRKTPVQPCLAAASACLMPALLARIAPAMAQYRARIAAQK